MEGKKWGESMLQDFDVDNPEYVICFTHSKEFEYLIEDHEDYVEYAYFIDPIEDDLYKGVFPNIQYLMDLNH